MEKQTDPFVILELLRHVYRGMFKPMTQLDWDAFAGADEGTTICYLDDGTTLLLSLDGTLTVVRDDGEFVVEVKRI